MDATARPPDHPLIAGLLREGSRFSFFQALSLLERSRPDAARIGETGPAAAEAVRIRPDVSLGFPPGAIREIEWLPPGGDPDAPGARGAFATGTAVPDGRFRVTATFLGLYGTDSPLPTYWAEDLLREQMHDTTVRDFLDLFHHRIYSLLYRLWAKYRFPVQFRGNGEDALSDRFLCLVGLGSPEVREAVELPVLRLLRYGGLLVQHPRSAAGLEAIVGDWFGGLPVTVTGAAGRWVPIPPSDRCRLGRAGCGLGENATLGSRVYDVAGGFQLRLGPMGLSAWRRFLPDGPDHAELRRLVRLYCTDPLDAELDVRLAGPEVPELRLDPEHPPRLGWTSWLKSGPIGEGSVLFALRESA